MKVLPQSIPDVLLIQPRVFEDERGYFFESYNHQKFVEATGLDINWVQDNESKSGYGVIRGLHFQQGDAWQTKLVRVSQGSVLDVVVDLRPKSLSYGQHVAVELSAKNKHQLLVPKGFAHGFIVTSEVAVFNYKCDELYNAEADTGINFFDSDLGIDIPIPKEDWVVSEKDRNLERLRVKGEG